MRLLCWLWKEGGSGTGEVEIENSLQQKNPFHFASMFICNQINNNSSFLGTPQKQFPQNCFKNEMLWESVSLRTGIEGGRLHNLFLHIIFSTQPTRFLSRHGMYRDLKQQQLQQPVIPVAGPVKAHFPQIPCL